MPYSVKRYETKEKYHAYKRCVKKVGEKDSSVNPYAVCRSSVYGKRK
jgi:hypothetical protein